MDRQKDIDMTFREHLARASATVRSWPPWKQSLLGGEPSTADEDPLCHDCHKLLTKWYFGDAQPPEWRWFCPHCYSTPADETPFPTREHMNVRQEDLDALQEDWDALCRDGAASRGEGETP